jgi:hypothetical protein
MVKTKDPAPTRSALGLTGIPDTRGEGQTGRRMAHEIFSDFPNLVWEQNLDKGYNVL